MGKLKQFDGMFFVLMFWCFFLGNGVNVMKSKSGGPTPVRKSSRMTSCFNDLNWCRSCSSTSSLLYLFGVIKFVKKTWLLIGTSSQND